MLRFGPSFTCVLLPCLPPFIEDMIATSSMFARLSREGTHPMAMDLQVFEARFHCKNANYQLRLFKPLS